MLDILTCRGVGGALSSKFQIAYRKGRYQMLISLAVYGFKARV